MLNGYDLTVIYAKPIDAFVALAAGELTEAELADWFRQHTVQR